MPNLSLRDQTTEFLLYTAPGGAVKVEVAGSHAPAWEPCFAFSVSGLLSSVCIPTRERGNEGMHSHAGAWERGNRLK